MGADDITSEILLRELLESIGDAEPPSAEDGWFTVQEAAAAAKGFTETQIRRGFEAGVKAGTHETRKFGNSSYYRKVRK